MATLGQLLAEHTYLKLQPNNKILCDVTNHEMSARADVVQSYINGKKFKKEVEWYKHDYSEFLPNIVVDKRNPKQLYCKVTKESLNKIPDEVRKHMQGKRFQRLLKEKIQADKEKEAKAAAKEAKAAAYAARISKEKADAEEDEDEEDAWDPAILEELLCEGSDGEAVPAAKGSKRKAEESEDDMDDVLGSDESGDEGESDEEEVEGEGEEDGNDSDSSIGMPIIRKVKVQPAQAARKPSKSNRKETGKKAPVAAKAGKAVAAPKPEQKKQKEKSAPVKAAKKTKH